MTAVKIAGAVILIASAAAYGCMKIASERRMIRDLESALELVRFTEDNIKAFSKDLPEIYAEWGSGGSEQKRIAEYFIGSGEISLSESEKSIVDTFRDEIGKKYRDESIELCEYTASRLSEALLKHRGESKNREKLYKTIPVMLAVSVVLILL